MNSSFFVANREMFIETMGDSKATFCIGYDDDSKEIDSDFWYLCGIDEPGWQLVMSAPQQKSWLIAPDINEIRRIFDGYLSAEDARKMSGVEAVLDNASGEKLKKKLSVKIGSKKPLKKLRAIKRSEELQQIKKAIRLTIEGLDVVKQGRNKYKFEYNVEADITHYFRWHNATHAFDPIVASGKNACTLHYVKNSSRLHETSLLLIDVGARMGRYSADITRTFSLSEPTKRQVDIHRAVQSARDQIISLLEPGMRINDYVKKADSVMIESLLSVGLMKHEKDMKRFRHFFPHAVSHGLGLDVHESLGGYEEFRPGMILTVEPGIYIPEESIGIRIEDDILITESGSENLTVGLSTDL